MNRLEIGACSWSIDRHDVCAALEVVGRELKLRVAQIGFFTTAAVEHASVLAISRAAHESQVTLVGGFLGFEGEDYSSIERLAETGGLGNDETFEGRIRLLSRATAIFAELGCLSVAIHAGTIPPPDHSRYRKLVDRVREAADVLAKAGRRLLLESGREPAERLGQFIAEVGVANLGVNFDPANFVTLGSDDATRAVSALRGRIDLVHMKDALAPSRAGVEMGRPSPLGLGNADIPRVLSKLRAGGYGGPLLVECSSALAGKDALSRGVEYLRSMLG